MNEQMTWEPAAEAALKRAAERMGFTPERVLGLRGRVEAIARERGRRTVIAADLDEAGARAMAGRPLAQAPAPAPAPEPNLQWDADALRDLEKETIYLRERLRQRVDTLVREAGERRVTLAHVQQARRMPSGMAAIRAAQEAPQPTAPPRPSWPVTFGAYRLGDMDGSVAICTLASEALMDELAQTASPGVAIIGRVFTDNLGVEKMVTNLVANHRLRTLILCGTESRHRVGQTLMALHANGRDGEGRVVGSEGPIPIVRSLSDKAVRIYREKMTVVDLRGEQDKAVILASARSFVSPGPAPWPEAWAPEVETTDLSAGAGPAMGGRFTPDPTGLFLIGLGPWGDTIEAEHYTREGYLDHRVVGISAAAITSALLEKGLVGDLGHALYVGRELQKAEVALRLHLSYEQDRELELPRG
jgi:tetrahydromethanopterin S-methyltransferase subunit A